MRQPRLLRRRSTAAVLVTPVLALGIVGVTAAPAYAADHPVGSSLELLTALTNAVDGDTVTFTSDITLAHFLPAVDVELEIRGEGHLLDGTGSYAGIYIQNTSASISDLTIQNTITSGIRAEDSSIELDGVTVTGAALDGLLITNDDGGAREVTIAASDFSANAADGINCDLRLGASIEITDTTANANGDDGFQCLVVTGSEIDLTDMSADDNAARGVSVGLNSGSGSVLRVGASDNGAAGIEATLYSTEATIADAVATGNGQSGIDLAIGSGALVGVESATTADNVLHGVAFDIESDGVLTLTRVESRGNGDTGLTGLANDGASVLVDESTIHDTPVGVGFGRTEPVTDSDLQLSRSTISASGTLPFAAALDGGSRLDIVNSTISGNGPMSLPAVAVEGLASTTFTLRHSTLTDNETTDSTVAVHGTTALVSHTIVGANTPGPQGDLRASGSVALTVDHSLIEQLAHPGVQTAVAAGSGNITGADPLLDPLADNGGRTLTHVPRAGSPILDSGNPAIAGAPATDQRGEERIRGAAIDIGAVEQPAILPATGAAPGYLIAPTAALLGLGVVALLARRPQGSRPPARSSASTG